MSRLPAFLLPLVVALAFLAAQCDEGTLPASSGIEGLVTIGPMCPVVQEGTDCPDQPFAATIAIEGGGGDEVARAESGADGRFRVSLAPGTYTLVPLSPNPGAPPQAAEQEVVVREDAYTHVDVQYDSGIR